MKNIKSFLPVFSGFYETEFESILDNAIGEIIDSAIYEVLKNGQVNEILLSCDTLSLHQNNFKADISKQCVIELQKKLSAEGIEVDIKFEKLFSPKFYNFTNDEIQCVYELNSDTLDDILSLVVDNYTLFDIYVKELFDSMNTFASFDNRISWEEVLERHSEFFGYILQFLCDEVWDYTAEEMLDGVKDNINLNYTF